MYRCEFKRGDGRHQLVQATIKGSKNMVDPNIKVESDHGRKKGQVCSSAFSRVRRHARSSGHVTRLFINTKPFLYWFGTRRRSTLPMPAVGHVT